MHPKFTVGIIGAAGYTAGELLRLLVHHPAISISWAQSQSQAGQPVTHIHSDLVGDLDLEFCTSAGSTVDVVFLCAGHGRSQGWVVANQPAASTLVIDLSSDHRLSEDWVYGLPELNRAAIKGHRRIANPGCFATAIQLGLLPLAAAGHALQDVHINALTGSTGAGQQARPTTHFSWRDNNVSIYKAFRHQHEAEINRSLAQAAGNKNQRLHFLPMRGNFSRGIYASLYTPTQLPEAELVQIYKHYYKDHLFVHEAAGEPHLKQVVNTNKGLFKVARIDERVLIISMIDNLLKGASGQAVQNMNLALGLPESLGLLLKPSAF